MFFFFSQRKNPCTFCSHSFCCTNWNFNGVIFIRRYIFQHNQYMIKCLLYMEWIDNICVYICLGRLWKHQLHFIWFNSNTKVIINWLNIFPYCMAYVSKQALSYWWNVSPTRNKECRQVLHWAQINVLANAIEIFFPTLVPLFLSYSCGTIANRVCNALYTKSRDGKNWFQMTGHGESKCAKGRN